MRAREVALAEVSRMARSGSSSGSMSNSSVVSVRSHSPYW
jgi:hypothetical protein